MPRTSDHRTQPALQPRKEPRQRRASATRDALMAAAAEVLEQGGLAGFNTNRVAEHAGLSVGSLYQYYPNKGAILVALQGRQAGACCELLERALQRGAPRTLAQTVGTVVAVLVRQRIVLPRLAAALDPAQHEASTAAALRAQCDGLQACIADALAPHRSALQGRVQALARDVLPIVSGLTDAALARGENPGTALRRRLERAVMGYLVGPAV